MEQKELNEKDVEEIKTLEKTNVNKLEEIGFIKSADKPGLFVKDLDDGTQFYWDFRKTTKGTAYATKDDVFLKDDIVKQMQEYVVIHGQKEQPVKTKAMVPASDKKAVGLLRGSERDIIRLMDHKIQLDSIIDASSDPKKLGEGLLWHELTFDKRVHVEPSAELVDLIAQDMGNVSVKIVEFDTNILEDPNSNKRYLTYYCVAEATDGITLTSGLGAAEQIIDFDEIKNKGRTFARTLVIRKASRNAVERLIPIPRKAMVYLIRKKLDEHKKGK